MNHPLRRTITITPNENNVDDMHDCNFFHFNLINVHVI